MRKLVIFLLVTVLGIGLISATVFPVAMGYATESKGDDEQAIPSMIAGFEVA